MGGRDGDRGILSVAGLHVGDLAQHGGGQRPGGRQGQGIALGQQQGAALEQGAAALPAGQGVAGPGHGRGAGQGKAFIGLPQAVAQRKVQGAVIQPLVGHFGGHGAAAGGQDDQDPVGQAGQILRRQAGGQAVVLLPGGEDQKLGLSLLGPVGEGALAQRSHRLGQGDLGGRCGLGKGAGRDADHRGLAVDVVRPGGGDGGHGAGVVHVIGVQTGQHIALGGVLGGELVVLGGNGKEGCFGDLALAQVKDSKDHGVLLLGVHALESHGLPGGGLRGEGGLAVGQQQGGGVDVPVGEGDRLLGQSVKGGQSVGRIAAVVELGVDHAAVQGGQRGVGGPGGVLLGGAGRDVFGGGDHGARVVGLQQGGRLAAADQTGGVVGAGGHGPQVQGVLDAHGGSCRRLGGHGLGLGIGVVVESGDAAHQGAVFHGDRPGVQNVSEDPGVGAGHAAHHGDRSPRGAGHRRPVFGRTQGAVVGPDQSAYGGGAAHGVAHGGGGSQRAAVLADQAAHAVVAGHGQSLGGHAGDRAVVDAGQAAGKAGAGQGAAGQGDVLDDAVILSGKQADAVGAAHRGVLKDQVFHPAALGDQAEQPEVALPGLGQAGQRGGRPVRLQAGQGARKAGGLGADGGEVRPGQIDVRDDM